MLAESTYVDTYTDVELTHYMQQHATDAEYLQTLLENGGGILRGVQVA
jgi:hypothetical protein